MLVAQPATEPMDKVLSHLCVGSLESANSEELLRRNGVTHCISVTTSHPSSHFPGIKYIHVDVQDDPAESIIKYFDPVHSAIDEAKANRGVAFVHCSAGVSRSAAFVISYVMRHERLSLSKAFAFVRGKRRLTNPNFGFIHQLTQYERRLQEMDPTYIPGESNFLVNHIRSIWPVYTESKSDADIEKILKSGKYNHIHVLYLLKNGLLEMPDDAASDDPPTATS